VCGTERQHAGDPERYVRTCGAAVASQAPLDRQAPFALADGSFPDWGDNYPPVDFCTHLGPVLRTDVCDLCSVRGLPFDVHACDVHGECILQPALRRPGKLRTCTQCRDYVADPERLGAGELLP
jgi:hypothetical protein